MLYISFYSIVLYQYIYYIYRFILRNKYIQYDKAPSCITAVQSYSFVNDISVALYVDKYVERDIYSRSIAL